MRKPPRKGTLAFAEDGSIAFGEAGEGSCFLRAQRIGALLLVEDNYNWGGVIATFSGLYTARNSHSDDARGRAQKRDGREWSTDL
ncbi:MAG TPA: hypothetical protein VKE72_07635 [Methylocella sp.]|nr:hypothetical protein [Methylocella sp.]